MKNRILLIALFWLLAAAPAAQADTCPPTVHNGYLQFARINLGDGYYNYATVLQLPEEDYGQQYRGYWMNYLEFPPERVPCDCPDEHQDCEDVSYDHVHYFHSLPLDALFYGSSTQTTVYEADALGFWRFEYPTTDGYQESGGIDYSQNCYGYATDYGTFILEDVESGFAYGIRPRCYVETHLDMGDAVLAYASGGHTIKIDSLQLCGGFPGHPQMQKLKETSEKFRDSPIYTREGNCPGVQLKHGWGPVVNLGGNQVISLGSYTLYKPKP